MYEIHEVSRKNHEIYTIVMTGAEVDNWCKAKNENYGYTESAGGDKSYSCWAVKINY